jgi:hypothetical protein
MNQPSLVDDVGHSVADVQQCLMSGPEIRLILERCLIDTPSGVSQLPERLIALLNTFCQGPVPGGSLRLQNVSFLALESKAARARSEPP